MKITEYNYEDSNDELYTIMNALIKLDDTLSSDSLVLLSLINKYDADRTSSISKTDADDHIKILNDMSSKITTEISDIVNMIKVYSNK